MAVRFPETVVFTPQSGGHEHDLHRHMEMFNQLGYSTAFVPYAFPDQKNVLSTVLSLRASVTHRWQYQLSDALDKIAGPKIIFSLSFPACAVAHLLAETPRSDVKGWITDGGPFLWPWLGIGNYFKYFRKDLSPGAHAAARVIGYIVLGGPFYEVMVRKWIGKIPGDFPILSIRAGRDALVPERSIEAVFSGRTDLNLTVFRLPQAEHLQGLKAFPAEYQREIEQFLQSKIARKTS